MVLPGGAADIFVLYLYLYLYFGKGNTKVVLPGGAADDTPYLCNCTSEHSPQSKCDLIWHNSIAPYFKCRTQMKTSNCPVCEQKENWGNHLMQVAHSIFFIIALREYFVSFKSNFESQNLQNNGIENQKQVLGKKRLEEAHKPQRCAGSKPCQTVTNSRVDTKI